MSWATLSSLLAFSGHPIPPTTFFRRCLEISNLSLFVRPTCSHVFWSKSSCSRGALDLEADCRTKELYNVDVRWRNLDGTACQNLINDRISESSSNFCSDRFDERPVIRVQRSVVDFLPLLPFEISSTMLNERLCIIAANDRFSDQTSEVDIPINFKERKSGEKSVVVGNVVPRPWPLPFLSPFFSLLRFSTPVRPRKPQLPVQEEATVHICCRFESESRKRRSGEGEWCEEREESEEGKRGVDDGEDG